MAEPTVQAGLLGFMSRYLDNRGVSIGPLLGDARIDPVALENPRALVSLNAVSALFDSAARRLGDPTLGLDCARHFPVGDLGPFDHLLTSAPTVGRALSFLAHYLSVQVGSVGVSFEQREGAGWFSWAWPASFTAVPTQFTDFALAALVLRLRLAAGPDWRPLCACLQHHAPEALDHYRQYFGALLRFDQPHNGIGVEARLLSALMPAFEPGLLDSVLESGDRMVYEPLAAADVASKTQKMIASRLAEEATFDLESISASLKMTSRSLQWRLAQEGTTYEKLLTLTRIVQAEHYLRDSSHPMTTIAALLGFSELSAFTRWTNRQFGNTPTAMRHNLRGSSLT